MLFTQTSNNVSLFKKISGDTYVSVTQTLSNIVLSSITPIAGKGIHI